MHTIISRMEARQNELKHYFTGKPCKYHHLALRLVCNGMCLDCAKGYSAKFAKQNPEVRKLSQKKWQQNNLDVIRNWRAANKDKVSANNRKYALSHSKSLKERNRNRLRTVYAHNPSSFVGFSIKNRAPSGKAFVKWADKEKIREIYLNRPKGCHVDHIVPLKNDLVCGLHNEFNLQYLTVSENATKRNRFEPQFILAAE